MLSSEIVVSSNVLFINLLVQGRLSEQAGSFTATPPHPQSHQICMSVYCGRKPTQKNMQTSRGGLAGLRHWFANATPRGTGFRIPPLPRAEFGRLAME